jgi:FixJ family two-component response regulator
MTKDQGEAESLVFVVDDDASVRQALTSLLQSVALRVEAFGSAADFLKRGRAGNGIAAACLILDVRLPGVSGLDFQAELVRADMHLPIIFITGYGDIPMTVRAMKAGAVEFLTKPFREQDLLDAVQLALQRDRDRRTLAMVPSMSLRSACCTPHLRRRGRSKGCQIFGKSCRSRRYRRCRAGYARHYSQPTAAA